MESDARFRTNLDNITCTYAEPYRDGDKYVTTGRLSGKLNFEITLNNPLPEPVKRLTDYASRFDDLPLEAEDAEKLETTVTKLAFPFGLEKAGVFVESDGPVFSLNAVEQVYEHDFHDVEDMKQGFRIFAKGYKQALQEKGLDSTAANEQILKDLREVNTKDKSKSFSV